jgi:hypothetical protein
MSNSLALLRTIIIFSVCLPLAIYLGYILAGPFDYTFIGVVGGIFFVLILPFLLRLHRPMLVLGWNATMIIFFLPGAPQVWLPLTFLSLLISVFRRSIDQNFRFLSVPAMTWPLVTLAAVVLITAEATGGIKLRSMGGGVYGGRNYFLVLTAILGYFALTAQPIPRERAGLYVGLFLLGGLTTLIGDVLYFRNPALRFIYMFFQPNTSAAGMQTGGLERFLGINMGSLVLIHYLLAKYGIRRIFSARNLWLCIVFVFLSGASLFGGFRSFLVSFFILLSIQFCLEGLHRTKLLAIIPLGLVLAGAVALPYSRHFPRTIQRAMSFLPIDIDTDVRSDADLSSEWRFKMWESVLPQVPQYLLLGKGYALSTQDFDYMLGARMGSMQVMSPEQDPFSVGGNYHNGPLSVTIPFGIWGDLAFLWFLGASIRILYRNYKYGAPELRMVNTFLLAVFITKALTFLVIAGALFSDMQAFVGYIGIGVALNGGVCSPAPKPVRDPNKEHRPLAVSPQYQPAFARPRARP